MSDPSSKGSKRFLRLSLLVVVALAMAMFGFAYLYVKEPLPQKENFVLSDMSTYELVKSSDFYGKVLYVDVWASWCIPCRESMPHAQTLANRYAGRGLAVIGVNQDTDMAAAHQFLQRLDIRFQQLADPKGAFMATNSIEALPTVLIFDRQGALQYRLVGFTSDKQAEVGSEVARLLAMP